MNKRTGIILLSIGVFIFVIGVALIIVAPSLFGIGYTNAEGQRNREIEDVVRFGGIALLIVGGAISAAGGLISTVGFGTRNVGARQKQIDGVFLYRDGQQYGPYQIEAIMKWHESGNLSDNDMVFDPGSSRWIPVVTFLGMNDPALASSASNTASPLDELEKLASLREKRIITEEEYEKKKKQILGI